MNHRYLPIVAALACQVVAFDAFAQQKQEVVDRSVPQLAAGMHVGMPTALSTGQVNGVSLGIEGGGLNLRWLGWIGTGWATESSLTWLVDHIEVRARAGVGAQLVRGRGTFMLRAIGGPTLVHEARQRHQSNRLTENGAALTTTATDVFWGVDVEAGVGVEVAGGWGVALLAGPSKHFGTPIERSFGWSGRVMIRRAWRKETP